MKRLSLRMRLTVLSSIMLTCACILLTLAINISANKMVGVLEASPLSPATNSGSDTLPMIPISKVAMETKADFQYESILAMIVIILGGTALTYYISGRAIEPVKQLTASVKGKDVDNLGELLTLPKTNDEVQALTRAFNEMTENLNHAFLLQKQFSADAAHELRTPLTVMQTKIDVFHLDKNHRISDYEELLISVENQIQRLTTLVGDLLLLGNDRKLERFEKVELQILLIDVVQELAVIAEEKNIRIAVTGSEGIVEGNDALLERAFFNLIENAIKYSDKNSTIEIVITDTINTSKVEIFDRGYGISDKMKALIFEPFFRVEKSRNREVGGSGLGLAICKNIITKHGGQIGVRDHLPQGSVFTVTFYR